MSDKDKRQLLILFIIVLVLLAINIIVYMRKVAYPNRDNEKAKQEYSNQTSQSNVIQNTTSNNTVEDTTIYGMSERSRMERYFTTFITYVENGQYEKAYDLLYPDFKQNYFATIDVFTKYCKDTYPKLMTFDYSNIERQGDIYVLTIQVGDALDRNKESFTQRFVIQEYDFNDYKLSFQVI